MEGPRHHKRIRPVASTTRTDLMRGSDRSDWLEVAAIEGNMPTALWVSLLSPILLLAYVAVVKAMGLTRSGAGAVAGYTNAAHGIFSVSLLLYAAIFGPWSVPGLTTPLSSTYCHRTPHDPATGDDAFELFATGPFLVYFTQSSGRTPTWCSSRSCPGRLCRCSSCSTTPPRPSLRGARCARGLSPLSSGSFPTNTTTPHVPLLWRCPAVASHARRARGLPAGPARRGGHTRGERAVAAGVDGLRRRGVGRPAGRRPAPGSAAPPPDLTLTKMRSK